MPSRLSVVTVGVRDLPLLRRFYAALGWAEIDGSDDDWTAYLVGGVLFALYPAAELAAEAGAEVPPTPTWSGVTLACNVDEADDVGTAFDAAVRAGAVPIAEPQTREWGGRSAYVADPEGTRWEIAWAPGARFDERGALTGFGG